MGGYLYDTKRMVCSHLVDGKCSVYKNRPFICRLYGSSELLQCENCTPERYLSKQETNELVHAYVLIKTEEFDKCIAFCKARLNLLSVFDDGCPDFYATHKFFTMLPLAHAYRKTGNKKDCLQALYALAALYPQMQAVAESEDFRVSVRNKLYFSEMQNDRMTEEYAYGFKLKQMLGAFDAFFGQDEEYKAFKNSIA